jgi:hypothetical protein
MGKQDKAAARFYKSHGSQRLRNFDGDYQVGSFFRQVWTHYLPPKPDLGFDEPAALRHAFGWIEIDRDALQSSRFDKDLADCQHTLTTYTYQVQIVFHAAAST